MKQPGRNGEKKERCERNNNMEDERDRVNKNGGLHAGLGF